MADEQFVLTQDGLESLQLQLAALQELRAVLSDELGDLGDDPGGNLDGDEAGLRHELQTTLDRVNERIGHIQFVLDRAIVPEQDPHPRRVDPGERVVVWDFVERREQTFDVLSGPEVEFTYARDENRRQVSADSPVGRALLGRRVGDIVEIEVPDGTSRYAIRHIERV
jgi:transcription elongation factor GreA